MLEFSALGNANWKTEETSELEKSNVAQESHATRRLSQAAEKGPPSPALFEKHPSGAKAHTDIAAFAARLKSCPDTSCFSKGSKIRLCCRTPEKIDWNEFFRSLFK
jgi:hypothetical protein